MAKYLVKRLLITLPIFLLITFFVFLLIDMVPGSPVDLLNESGELTPEAYAEPEHALGLDRPFLVRYASWLGDMLRGDMGVSNRTKQPLAVMIGERIGPSLTLTLSGLLLAVLISIPLGTMSACKPYSLWDNLSSVVAFIGTSAPGFFLCLLAIYLFSVKLGWLPASGMYDVGTAHSLSDLLRHLLMPALIVGLQLTGSLIKQTRGSVLEVMNEEYIKTARSKGISEQRVIVRHALRNALIPIVTQIIIQVPFLVGGSVAIEKIFGWPGIGSLMVTSISSRDYNTILGIAVVICIAVLAANILLDILYSCLDPRITYDE